MRWSGSEGRRSLVCRWSGAELQLLVRFLFAVSLSLLLAVAFMCVPKLRFLRIQLLIIRGGACRNGWRTGSRVLREIATLLHALCPRALEPLNIHDLEWIFY